VIMLSIVALGNMGVTIWLIRENRRITQLAISRHTGDFTSMVRAEKTPASKKKKKDDEDVYHTWRYPSEGVAP
jgi:hypothetical protein